MNEASEIATRLIDWYWHHGVQRRGAYAIPFSWIARCYHLRDLLQSIKTREDDSKASIGLWGPSQSGKSTLLAHAVDSGAGEDGSGGLLDWGIPTLFSAKSKVHLHTVVFNPRNGGSDATGCICRFAQMDDADLPYPDYPVEIKLLNRRQIMHSLSAGFSLECKTGRPLTLERVSEWLDESIAHGVPDLQAFELVLDVVHVMELFVQARNGRFSGLDAGGNWHLLANQILESPSLVCNLENALRFMANVLWDGHPQLTNLFDQLLSMLDSIAATRLFCSMEVASTLVDIASASNMQDATPNDHVQNVQRIIRNLRVELSGPDLLLGTEKGDLFLPHERQFAHFQGLVQELVVPLRKSQPTQLNGFGRCLQKAEIVDFPGIPLRDIGVQEQLIDLEKFSSNNSIGLLTKVLKRGKVASLVMSYSRTLGIDAFLLITRSGTFTGKLEQLHGGLAAWWNFFDPSYDVYASEAAPPLPLFFNLTFFSRVLNDTASGFHAAGLKALAEMAKDLYPFVAPNNAITIATTYPQFDAGQLTDDAKKNWKHIVETIRRDVSFGHQVSSPIAAQSLERVVNDPDGGADFLFGVLAEEVSITKRQSLLKRRKAEAIRQLVDMIASQSPVQSTHQRREDIQRLRTAIHDRLGSQFQFSGSLENVVDVSYFLRKLVDFDPNVLEPIPSMEEASHAKLENYVQAQLTRWIETKSTTVDMKEIGLDDNALRNRLMGYISETVAIREIVLWMVKNFRNTESQDARRELRRVFAWQLSKQTKPCLAAQHAYPDLSEVGGVIDQISSWAIWEASPDSQTHRIAPPHYVKVIKPFLDYLNELLNQTEGERPVQPGDDTLIELNAELTNVSSGVGV